MNTVRHNRLYEYRQLLVESCKKHNIYKLGVGLALGTIFALHDWLDGCCVADIIYYNYIGSLLCTYLIWTLSIWISSVADLHFNWLEKPYRKIIFLLLCNVAIVVASLISIIIFMQLLKGHEITLVHIYKDLFPSILVTIIINLLLYGLDFFKCWRDTLMEVEQLKQENLRSQLESLKNQVNPHFLFNSLNTLISVIDEDPEIAKNYVQQLSNVYRYILQAKDKTLVTVEEELKFLESYIYLLQIRYGENLRFDIRLPEKYLETKIPPLTLQILAENAIKHNVVSATRPLSVEIFIENDKRLIIRNNLQMKSIQVESNKVGLLNICERYKLSDNEDVEVVQSEKYFSVSLPVIFN